MVTFPDKNQIVEAIAQAERGTSGEIRVHVARGSKRAVMDEAKKIFQKLGMHKTKARNGVLSFVALKNHEFSILGDTGIHAVVGDDFWKTTRDRMEARFKKDDLTGGIVAGVLDAGEKLKTYFPCHPDDQNELSNSVSEGK
jgi:uncharacterized membrane protein